MQQVLHIQDPILMWSNDIRRVRGEDNLSIWVDLPKIISKGFLPLNM
jgi:hypothetical protein